MRRKRGIGDTNRCLILLLSVILHLTVAVELKGAEVSFIKYAAWQPCQNGTLSFEFKTQQMNALLLYMDDASNGDFMQVKLVGSSVSLILNLGHGVLRLNVGHALNDDSWHRVQVIRNAERTTLVVDKTSQTLSSIGPEHNFGKKKNDKYVYIGGVPPQYSGRMSELPLPSVLFEPNLRGSVRNVLYKNCGGPSHRPDMVDFEGIRSSQSDKCETNNPCQNRGICLSTDKDVVCDCAATEFDGKYCETRKTPSDATFFGKEYLSYDLSGRGDPIVSNKDTVNVQFKTRHSNGLLFYTGKESDYITVGLQNGQVFVAVNLGSGGFTRTFKKKMDDNEWHTVEVAREARETVVKIDHVIRLTESTVGDFTMLSSSIMYVGGHPVSKVIPGAATPNNFKGCLRKVQYRADSINLDIVELANTKHDFIEVKGKLLFNKCKDIVEPQPITFTTPQSYITIRAWQPEKNASISFKFSTTEKSGLLMYNGGTNRKSDFFAFEIIDSHLYFVMDMGSGVIRKKVSVTPITDGMTHVLKLSHSDEKGTLRLDDVLTHYVSLKPSDSLALKGMLYIGGASSQKYAELSRQIWSATVASGFVGCFRDLTVNSKKIDLIAVAKNQGATDIGNFCKTQQNHCSSTPCLHRGACANGWDRYICDCSRTGYYGRVCQKVATTLTFDGGQHIKIPFTTGMYTEADDFSLRFKTAQPDGLLFITTADQSADSLELSLQTGTVQIMLNLGSGGRTLRVGSGLNDNRWHTVFIRRRAQHVELRLDDYDSVKENIPGEDRTLSYSNLYVGALLDSSAEGDIRSDSGFMDFSSVELGKYMSDPNNVYKRPGFVGSMQQFIFNKKQYFEMIVNGEVTNVQLTAMLGTDDLHLHNPITFKAKSAYAIVPLTKLQSTAAMSVFFFFRTTERDGIILYTGGRRNFLALELTDGYLYFIYNIKSRANRVRVNTRSALNDNKWHEVTVLRQKRSSFTIRVDDESPTEDRLVDPTTPHFSFKKSLFIGGVKKTLYKNLPDLIISRYGFQGCFASLDVNGFTPDILRDAKSIVGSIVKGCKGPVVQCKADSCLNKGRCIQHWTSYRCDCDMTSYTGPRCADESISYKFGEDIGIMTYTFPVKSRPSTKRDSLALGFMTYTSNCVLARVDSGISDDYIELEIVDGNVYVVYNMGTADYPIGELFSKVNDGKYHVVRYERHGPNSTIQLDNLSAQKKNPEGKQLSEFNEQSSVQIGGKKDDRGKVSKPFTGIISGLVYNGIRILDLASDSDPRVTTEGDVDMEVDNNNIIVNNKGFDTENWQSTQGIRQTTPRQGVTDDIIFAAGSGCRGDDEDECTENSAGHEDDIITPVITITTPTSKPRSDKPSIPTPERKGCKGRGNCNRKGEKGRNGKKNGKGSNKKNGGRRKSNGGKPDPTKKSGYQVNEVDIGPMNVTLGPDDKSIGGAEPGSSSGDSAELNLALIIGIAVGVLVALVVLIILLYKFRSRDEGAYKVEETQTFAFVAEGNKTPQANGNSKHISAHPTKSKKRDVKEWYV